METTTQYLKLADILNKHFIKGIYKMFIYKHEKRLNMINHM